MFYGTAVSLCQLWRPLDHPSAIHPIPYEAHKSQLELHHGKNHKWHLSDLPSVWVALAEDVQRGSAGCAGVRWGCPAEAMSLLSWRENVIFARMD